ncbi:MAG: hypothetical protein KatS3mg031_1464 [Chitinophagales bacterium]|nr:MAG: hypothetical protein KatS3mg031_1464 [Chitinophagales bacterium]
MLINFLHICGEGLFFSGIVVIVQVENDLPLTLVHFLFISFLG